MYTMRDMRSTASAVLMGGALALGLPMQAGADVLAGFDLIITQDGTEFDPDGPGGNPPIPVTGVPIGLFDFGGATGVVDVGNVDTIVERKTDATDATPVVDTEIIALQLVTVDPVNLGAGLDFHYITLQSQRGTNMTDPPPGPPSDGQLTFDPPVDDGGFVGGFFGIFVDVRIGALDGDIIASLNEDLALSTEKDTVVSPVPWSSNPWGTPTDPIPRVDWETGLQIKHGLITVPHPQVPNGGFYLAHAPEPSTAALMGLALAFPMVLRRRRARRGRSLAA